MGLKNNLELKGGLYPEALLIRCIFLFPGQEMSVHVDGLINGGVGAYRHQFTLAVNCNIVVQNSRNMH